jgi:hypothetical protein
MAPGLPEGQRREHGYGLDPCEELLATFDQVPDRRNACKYHSVCR